MGILTESGRIALAEAVSAQTMHMAWGLGDGEWTTPPDESGVATTLINEVGRRAVTSVQFVSPDEAGEIVMPGGNYMASIIPTNYLHITALFDFADAGSLVIREAGLFIGTQTDAGLPPGQKYFVPAEVTDPGRLLHLENLAPLYRSVAIQENFQLVIEI